MNKIKKAVMLMTMCMPLINTAQDGGIQWTRGLSWEQVKEKAKQENKYIFLDCYATWCAPCKKMDKEIYPNDTVGNFMNQHFISIKVQLDSTKNDDEEIKKWYAAARLIEKQYGIRSLPTYLFFSPDGKLLSREVGFKDKKEFITLAEGAPKYVGLLEQYNEGKLPIEQFPDFALQTKKLGEKELSLKIANDYIHNYIDRLPDDSFFTKPVLSFLSEFSDSLQLTHRFVTSAVKQSVKVDRIMYKRYSEGVVYYFSHDRFVRPLMAKAFKDGTEPDWNNFRLNLKKYFGDKCALETLLETKCDYYKAKKDWKNYTQSLIEKVGKNYTSVFKGVSLILGLNNDAWDIFLYSNNAKDLNKALNWSDYTVKMLSSDTSPNGITILGWSLDTKANLLYKLGRIDEAIKTQEKALAILPLDSVTKDHLEKMKKGEKTWQEL